MTIQHPSPHLLPEVGDRAFDDEVRGRVDRARQLRAEAAAETIVAAWDILAHALRASAAWLTRRRREAQARHALEQCSDRTLADIGIRPQDIPLVASAAGARASVRWSRRQARQRSRVDQERLRSGDRSNAPRRPEIQRAA